MPMRPEAVVGVGLQVNFFVLQAASQPLDKDVVQPAPAAVHADPHLGGFQLVGKCCAGELRPWSVLKISGRPLRRASSRASRQNEVSIVFDRRQARTCRLYQSITATR